MKLRESVVVLAGLMGCASNTTTARATATAPPPAATAAPPAASEHPSMFPQPGPIEGADPAVRRATTIRVPTRLLIERRDDAHAVRWDPASMREVTVEVGARMVLGAEVTDEIHRDGAHDPTQDSVDLSGMDHEVGTGGTSYIRPGPSAGSVALHRRLRVFETDIPTQHEWSPRSGRFRVLFESETTSLVH